MTAHVIGIDTNVLLRLFANDNPEQRAATVKLMKGRGPGSVRLADIVVTELVWTLTRRYRMQRDAVVSTVERLLRQEEFVFENRSAIMIALRWFENGRADFADYLIAALNEEAGAASTYTFDLAAARHPAFTLLAP